MPLVELTIAEGRAPEQLRGLISGVTTAVQESIDVPKETIRVILREVPLTHWATGDVTLAERQAMEGADSRTG